MHKTGRGLLIAIALIMGSQYLVLAQQEDPPKLYEKIDEQTDEIFNQVVDWRRHFHQNPELSNRETKTAEYIADYLRDLGMKVETDIAHTGVVGVLKGDKKGPVVGLRADIDALPVKERTDVPLSLQKRPPI